MSPLTVNIVLRDTGGNLGTLRTLVKCASSGAIAQLGERVATSQRFQTISGVFGAFLDSQIQVPSRDFDLIG